MYVVERSEPLISNFEVIWRRITLCQYCVWHRGFRGAMRSLSSRQRLRDELVFGTCTEKGHAAFPVMKGAEWALPKVHHQPLTRGRVVWFQRRSSKAQLDRATRHPWLPAVVVVRFVTPSAASGSCRGQCGFRHRASDRRATGYREIVHRQSCGQYTDGQFCSSTSLMALLQGVDSPLTRSFHDCARLGGTREEGQSMQGLRWTATGMDRLERT